MLPLRKYVSVVYKELLFFTAKMNEIKFYSVIWCKIYISLNNNPMGTNRDAFLHNLTAVTVPYAQENRMLDGLWVAWVNCYLEIPSHISQYSVQSNCNEQESYRIPGLNVGGWGYRQLDSIHDCTFRWPHGGIQNSVL